VQFVLIDLIFLLLVLILYAMFNQEFFLRFSFFMLLLAVLMYDVYIYIFLAVPYGEIKLIIEFILYWQGRYREV